MDRLVRVPIRCLPRHSRARETGEHIEEWAVLDPMHTAFVLVDVWDWHRIATHWARVRQITEEKIVPALAAARRAGLQIVHAPGTLVAMNHPDCKYRLSPLTECLPSDHMNAGGMGDWLARREIVDLVYVGFATNGCLLKRPYGVRAMAALGHRIIVLRDATTATEYPGTIDGLWATKVAIGEIERYYGHTALTEDFINACHT